jgi:hypothetical protein
MCGNSRQSHPVEHNLPQGMPRKRSSVASKKTHLKKKTRFLDPINRAFTTTFAKTSKTESTLGKARARVRKAILSSNQLKISALAEKRPQTCTENKTYDDGPRPAE